MVLNEWAFNAMHIPGSINISSEKDWIQMLNQGDEIVDYCSNDKCTASLIAYEILVQKGFKNVSRYVGGLTEWKDAGYPLEGEMVK